MNTDEYRWKCVKNDSGRYKVHVCCRTEDGEQVLDEEPEAEEFINGHPDPEAAEVAGLIAGIYADDGTGTPEAMPWSTPDERAAIVSNIHLKHHNSLYTFTYRFSMEFDSKHVAMLMNTGWEATRTMKQLLGVVRHGIGRMNKEPVKDLSRSEYLSYIEGRLFLPYLECYENNIDNACPQYRYTEDDFLLSVLSDDVSALLKYRSLTRMMRSLGMRLDLGVEDVGRTLEPEHVGTMIAANEYGHYDIGLTLATRPDGMDMVKAMNAFTNIDSKTWLKFDKAHVKYGPRLLTWTTLASDLTEDDIRKTSTDGLRFSPTPLGVAMDMIHYHMLAELMDSRTVNMDSVNLIMDTVTKAISLQGDTEGNMLTARLNQHMYYSARGDKNIYRAIMDTALRKHDTDLIKAWICMMVIVHSLYNQVSKQRRTRMDGLYITDILFGDHDAIITKQELLKAVGLFNSGMPMSFIVETFKPSRT